MAKALFFNVPGHGHITPSLPLVAELVRRGHEITYFATPRFRPGIEATGAAFRAYETIGDDYLEAPGMTSSVPLNTAYELIRSTGEMLPALVESARAVQPDLILFDGMCPWGYYTARVLGVPAVASLALLPLGSPPLSAMLKPEFLRAILPMLLRKPWKGQAAHRQARALGRRYNVPPLALPAILNATGDLSLSYTSSYFAPFADQIDPSVRFIGWTLGETPVAEPVGLERAQGRPLIYVSLGTLHQDSAPFFRACAEAFAGSDAFVVMSTGRRVDLQAVGALPNNVEVHAWVPQTAVLKQASLFITHGGLNSVHDGLYLGVPLLLVPQQGEQALTALRAAELGAGLLLKKAQATAQAIRAAAGRLLTEPGFGLAAARIGETLRTAGGPARGADEIEALLQRRRRGD